MSTEHLPPSLSPELETRSEQSQNNTSDLAELGDPAETVGLEDPSIPANPAETAATADPSSPESPESPESPPDPASPASPASTASPASPASTASTASQPDPANPASLPDPANLPSPANLAESVDPVGPAERVNPAETVDPADPARPTGPLHVLCLQCTSFCASWPILEYLQIMQVAYSKLPEVSTKALVPNFPKAHLCKLSQIFSTATVCQLCYMLAESLKNCYTYHRFLIFSAEKVKNADVWLWATMSGKHIHVQVGVGEESMNNDFELFISWGESYISLLKPKGNVLEGVYRRGFRPTDVLADVPGRGFQSNLGAESVPLYAHDNISLAKAWIEECSTQHTECQQFHLDTVGDRIWRPTRVLEVGEDTVRLRCNTSKEAFEYLVLSHIWAPESMNQPRLLQSNMARYQIEIPKAELSTSSTFRDAITTVRTLGYRYLWIDSLCIIQDCDRDWEYEADRMAIVYGNAVCNLAFLFPPTVSTRIPRNPWDWSSCIIRRPTDTSLAISEQANYQLPTIHMAHRAPEMISGEYFKRSIEKHPWLLHQRWPLFFRAWTFQEYLLSPRTLFIGAQHLMFNCSTHFMDEMLGLLKMKSKVSDAHPRARTSRDFGKCRYFPDCLKRVMQASSLSEPVVIRLLIDWTGVINEYRERRLSHITDRVVAFSGIARAMSNMGNLTFLAGLWAELLPLSLLWFVRKKILYVPHPEDEPAEEMCARDTWTDEMLEPIARPAPSWSWFAIPMYRYYEIGFLYGELGRIMGQDEIFMRARSYRDPPEAYWDDLYWAEVEVPKVESNISEKPGSPNGFTEFRVWSLELLAYALPTKFNWPEDLEAQQQVIKDTTECPDDRDFSTNMYFNYWPDVPPPGRNASSRRLVYAIISEFQLLTDFKGNSRPVIQRRFSGLMLAPGKEADTYKRVGAWKLDLHIMDVPMTNETMAAVAKRWRKYRLLSSEWGLETFTLV